LKSKFCIKCGKELIKAANAQKHCKQCAKELEKKHIKNWTKNNKKRLTKYFREYNLKNRYGLTSEQWQQMFDKQQGCCAICGRHQTEFTRILSVEHNHFTKEVRGLVCDNCNHLIDIYETEFYGLKDKIRDYLEGSV